MFKGEICPCMLLEMNISLSHVQNTFFLQTLWYGNWTWGIGFEVKCPSTEGSSVKLIEKFNFSIWLKFSN